MSNPEFLSKYDTQNEVNFHNFANNISEHLYYLGAFLLLILFPFTGHKINLKINLS